MSEVIVSTDWVEKHLNDPNVRIVELDYDPATAYEVWHVPNAVLIAWKELRHPVKRDFIDSEGFEKLMSKSESPQSAPWSSTVASTNGAPSMPSVCSKPTAAWTYWAKERGPPEG